jgi:uncharacterized repeat protein (TIGR03803 family)
MKHRKNMSDRARFKAATSRSMDWCACALVALVAAPLAAQTTETVLHNFGAPASGAHSGAGVIRDAKGKLYGTTTAGGVGGSGVVFELDTNGQQSVLHSFTGGADGASPSSGVVRDSAGSFYGTTSVGGAAGLGTVYKLTTSGQETVLHSFTGGVDGETPMGGVVVDSAGNLYGTTNRGGASNVGIVYKLSAAGQETILYNFTNGVDGGLPASGVIRDSAGNLYGTTSSGGSAGLGTVYKLDISGNETVLHSFAGGQDGADPQTGVTLDSAGNLYGTTTSGGASYAGTVYEVAVTGIESVLYSFTGGADGLFPSSGLVRDSAGNLYGTTSNGGPSGVGVLFKISPSGGETVLDGFTFTDGDVPSATPVLDSAGNLYGTTEYGGAANNGVVYEVSASGQETVLYTFPGDVGGADPIAGVIEDSAGNLYGTAYSGGPANAGVVYKLDPKGREDVLHSFKGGQDGAGPYAGVIRDSAGNLYGTTTYGGSANLGVVYKIDTTGQETVLHSFSGGNDGANPYAGVITDSAGNLYGTTYYGGTANAGVVYKVDPTGNETVLYSFTGGADGNHPQAGLLEYAGNFIGTTQLGGVNGVGVVYEIDAAGQESVLHSFDVTDGAQPVSGVIRDSSGNLYGTAAAGGGTGIGVIYKLDPNGLETVLYSFGGGLDGDNPSSGLVRDSAGNLYGTTPRGLKSGAVYRLNTTGTLTVLHSFRPGADGGAPYGGLIRDSSGALFGTASVGGKNSSGLIFKLH